MQALALTGVRVWDGLAERASAGPQTIRIEDGKIAAIGSDPSLARDASVYALTQEHVAIPGLIDAHVHVTLDPGGRIDEQRERPHEDVVRQSEARLAAMVRAGITTARDLMKADFRTIESERPLRDALEILVDFDEKRTPTPMSRSQSPNDILAR